MKTQNENYIRVFLFFIVGIVVFVLLGMQFIDTRNWFEETYSIKLRSKDVGGIAVGAKVLMAGIQVGTVKEIYLGDDGTYGVIVTEIDEKYQIRSDSAFSLQQAGFLGEQYVGIAAVKNSQANFLKNGDVLECTPPFSIAAMASSADVLMDSAKETSDSLRTLLNRVNNELLSEETITNFSGTVAGLNKITHRVDELVEELKDATVDDLGVIKTTISNIDGVVEKLGTVADDIHGITSDNRENIGLTISNLCSVSANLNAMLEGINTQKGVAGSVVYDDALKNSFQTTMSNLVTLSSNLSAYGILRYPRARKSK